MSVQVSLRISGRLTPLKRIDFLDGDRLNLVKVSFLEAHYFLQNTMLGAQSPKILIFC